MTDPQRGDEKPGFFSLAFSLLSAAFGVQSSRNRERDFKQGKAIHFIAGGIIFAAVFVVVIVLLVRLILPG
jgi:hypothetical protein